MPEQQKLVTDQLKNRSGLRVETTRGFLVYRRPFSWRRPFRRLLVRVDLSAGRKP